MIKEKFQRIFKIDLEIAFQRRPIQAWPSRYRPNPVAGSSKKEFAPRERSRSF
jgi:hypothetical protein